MTNELEVSIGVRSVLLNVFIPDEKCVWDFMVRFGREFAVKDVHEGIKLFKPVDDYREHPAGWHIRVRVWDNEEARFYDFLRAFCSEKGLAFREPDAPPVT